MRITNSLIQARALAALQQNLAGLEKANTAASSGIRVSAPSDDPVSAGVIIGADQKLGALQQYKRNVDSAQVRLDAEEDALDNLGNLLVRARELATGQATGTANPASRAASLAEVRELRSAAIQLGNTSVGGVYIFGGQYADTPPLDINGALSTTKPPTATLSIEISDSEKLAVGHGADEVFEQSGVLDAFDSLITGLTTNDQTLIGQAGDKAAAAFTNLQNITAEVGARASHIEAASENIDSLTVTLKKFRSSLAEIDFETAVSELVQRQTALQSALLATSKILNTSLTDYLR